MFILTCLLAEPEVVAAEVDMPLDFLQILAMIFPHFFGLPRDGIDLHQYGLQHFLRNRDELLEPQFNFLHELRSGVKQELTVINLVDQ